MKGRIATAMLAIFFGTFGAQKFYLGKKLEGLLCILFSWTGIPTLLGIFEGFGLLSKNTTEWEEYCEILKKPKYYLNTMIAKTYLYPIGIAAFVFGFIQSEHHIFRLSGLLLLIAIWFYPHGSENIFTNRLFQEKHKNRWLGSFYVIAVVIGIVFFGTPAPKINLMSDVNTTQTGGVYDLQIEANPSTSVTIGGVVAETIGEHKYHAPIDIKDHETKVMIHAEYKGKTRDQEVTITRALNDAELAAIAKQKQDEENKKLIEEKTKQEELAKQQAEDAKCTKSAKCRKEKELSKKMDEQIKKDAQLNEWIKLHSGIAWSYCKQGVTAQLRAPSTADFPWADSNIWAAGGFLYVHSYVDSQNGFGAQIRSNFTCKMDVQGDGITDVTIVEIRMQ